MIKVKGEIVDFDEISSSFGTFCNKSVCNSSCRFWEFSEKCECHKMFLREKGVITLKNAELIDDKMLKFYMVCTFKVANEQKFLTMIVECKDSYSAIKFTQKKLDEKYRDGCILNVIQIE